MKRAICKKKKKQFITIQGKKTKHSLRQVTSCALFVLTACSVFTGWTGRAIMLIDVNLLFLSVLLPAPCQRNKLWGQWTSLDANESTAHLNGLLKLLLTGKRKKKERKKVCKKTNSNVCLKTVCVSSDK